MEETATTVSDSPSELRPADEASPWRAYTLRAIAWIGTIFALMPALYAPRNVLLATAERPLDAQILLEHTLLPSAILLGGVLFIIGAFALSKPRPWARAAAIGACWYLTFCHWLYLPHDVYDLAGGREDLVRYAVLVLTVPLALCPSFWLLPLLLLGSRHLNAWFRTGIPAHVQAPTGIGGWLLLPAIGLILDLATCVIYGVGAAVSFMDRPGGHDAPLMLAAVLTAGAIFICTLIITIALFRKSPWLPYLMIARYVVRMLAIIGVLTVAEYLMPTSRSARANQASLLLLIGIYSAAATSIWLTYFMVSRRVAATFMRKAPG